MEFIRNLSESKLFPSKEILERYSRREIAELLYLYIIAFRIFMAEESTRFWASNYLRKTIQHGEFSRWQTTGNDLYVLIYAIQAKKGDEKPYPLRMSDLTRWIKQGATRREFPDRLTDRLFVRLDFDLRIKHESMRAVRRLVSSWPTLEKEYRRLAMTRLLQFLRARSPKSDILLMLRRLAEIENYELKNVFNMETGEFEHDQQPQLTGKESFLQKLIRSKK
jgi:hypothetical protein